MSTSESMKWEDVERAVREYEPRVGQVIGESGEYVVDQKMNDIFGTVIENPDVMHNDPEWAAQSPLGGTVVYGFLQLALTTVIWKDLGMPLVTSDEAYALIEETLRAGRCRVVAGRTTRYKTILVPDKDVDSVRNLLV